MLITLHRAIASVAMGALAGGCASGGGGSGGAEVLGGVAGCILSLGLVCGPAPAPSDTTSTVAPSSPTATGFTSWTDLRRDALTEVNGLRADVLYASSPNGLVTSTSERTSAANAHVGGYLVQYDSQGSAFHVDLGGGGGFGSRSSPAHRNHIVVTAVDGGWMDLGRNDAVTASAPQSPFTSVTAMEIEISANPYILGWNYQSFGYWNVTESSWRNFGAATFGSVTPASAVPSSGTADFAGKLGGLYISPAGEAAIAGAKVNVGVDFGARSLTLTSADTQITRDLVAGAAAPHLNVSGTLVYSPAANSFSGTLTNAGSTMTGSSKGQFYGPGAEELGGVFTLKSATTVETFGGAYGARR